MKSRISEYLLGSGFKAIYASNIQHDFPRHSHESYLMEAILRGSRIVVSDKCSSIYSSGEVFLLEPYREHSCISGFEGGYDYIAISVPQDRFIEFEAGDSVSEILLLFEELFVLLEEAGVEIRLKKTIQENVREVCNRIGSTDKKSELSRRINMAAEFISENYGLKLSLADIAEYVSMSKYNFQRSFVREFGMSPAAYIDKRRVGAALMMIKDGNPPGMVAIECGFADQSHLCRVVKKVTGVTIGNYDICD